MVCKRCSAECTCKKVKRKPRAKPRYGRYARNQPQVLPPMPQQIIYQNLPAVKQKEEMRMIPSVRADYLPEGVPRPTQAPATERAMMGGEDRPRVREAGTQLAPTLTPTQERAMMEAEDVRTKAVETVREQALQAYTEGLTEGYGEGYDVGAQLGYERAMGTPVPGAGKTMRPVSALLAEAEKGRKVITRPGGYEKSQESIENVLGRIEREREAMAGGGAVGGGAVGGGAGVDIAEGQTPTLRRREAQLVAPPAIPGVEIVKIRRRKPKLAPQAGGEQAPAEKEE